MASCNGPSLSGNPVSDFTQVLHKGKIAITPQDYTDNSLSACLWRGPSRDEQIMDKELIIILGGYIFISLVLCVCTFYLL
jgi:hypothetical protein